MALATVSFRSAHGPPFAWSLDAPAGGSTVQDGGPAPASSSGFSLKAWLLAWLRPELRVVTPFGTITKAPGGAAPETSTWPLVPIVAGGILLFVLVLAGVGVAALVRSK